MQPFTSAFSSLTFLLLLVSLTILAVPTTAGETVPFNRSGRVVNQRVPRLLKHYKPRRPYAAALHSRTYGGNDNQGGSGYGSPSDDNHGYGGGNDNSGHGYGQPEHGGDNDNGGHGGYGGGNDNGGHGGYGGGNDNDGHGGYGGGNDNGGHGGYGGGNDHDGHGGYGGGNDHDGHGGYSGGNGYPPPVYGHPSQSPPKPTSTPYMPPGHSGSHGY